METNRIKILSIDDIQDNLISLKALIKEAFPEAVTLTALSGEKGLELAASEDPDVILLDIVMPGMDGFEVCQKLKADRKLSDIPVVFVTALKDDKASRISALEAGAEAFLAKPIDESELTAQIRAMLKIRTANIDKRDEKARLDALVEEQVAELKRTHLATLNLLEDLQRENEARKLSKEALRKSEERHRLILQTAMDGFWVTDLQGCLLEVNVSYCRMSGYSEQELLTMNIAALEVVETVDDINFRIQKLMRQGCDRFETRHRRKDGSIFDVEASVQHHTIDGGRCVTFLRDITERKLAEEEKTKLEAQLQQAQKMESVGRLAGGVAHDFNNMLGVILGHAEMALMKMEPALPFRANLEEIRKAAERSANITRQLLAFARKQTIAPKVLNLNDTVSNMLKMLQRLIGEDINLVWQSAANLWQVKVDPSQIDQILANLCVNARDAIADIGRITIETENFIFDETFSAAHTWAVPGEYVCLAISDNGCGMDKETLLHIFEPFFTTKEIGKGTGLGLATVYGIVKQNNCFIDVYSEPGQGTTFKIYFPRQEVKSDHSLTENTAKPIQRGKETILLVEDEPSILELITLILEGLDYTVLKTGTPAEAIRLAREHSGEIQLLITDVVMPGMNGLDLANNLLSIYPGLKRLFMSGYTSDVIARHGVLDEGVNFIQKPFSMQVLAAKIREVLDSK